MTYQIPKFVGTQVLQNSRRCVDTALANSNPLLIRRGLIEGAAAVHKYGRNSAVPNGSWAGILQVAAQFPWLTAATTVRVKVGGDAADTVDGAGARTVVVQGIGEAGTQIQETITTAGAAASTSTTLKFWRVYRAWVASTGTYTGSNTADVVIEATAGTDLIVIAAGEGQSQFCAFTIPSGKKGYLMGINATVDGLKPADLRLYTREGALTVAAPFQAKRLKQYWDGVVGSMSDNPQSPMLEMQPLTDIWMEANGSGAGTEVSAEMEIILFDV